MQTREVSCDFWQCNGDMPAQQRTCDFVPCGNDNICFDGKGRVCFSVKTDWDLKLAMEKNEEVKFSLRISGKGSFGMTYHAPQYHT